jgi:hypothetical protein
MADLKIEILSRQHPTPGLVWSLILTEDESDADETENNDAEKR